MELIHLSFQIITKTVRKIRFLGNSSEGCGQEVRKAKKCSDIIILGYTSLLES